MSGTTVSEILADRQSAQCDGVDGSCSERWTLIEALLALLAVAKAARDHVDEWDRDFHAPYLLGLLDQLDAAFPDWRTWQP